jgi:hypothetical protein
MELSVQMTPSSLNYFPNQYWTQNLYIMGEVTMEKYRPDDVDVSINATIDTDWVVILEPMVMRFKEMGTRVQRFEVTIFVPYETFGPPVVNMEFRVSANIVGRTVEDVAHATINVIADVDQIMDIPMKQVKLEVQQYIDGEVNLYNIMDYPLELHLTALLEWADKFPDLDFQSVVLLQPMERARTRFSGTLVGDLEPGDYNLPVALWTPDGEGGRTFITMENLTLMVEKDPPLFGIDEMNIVLLVSIPTTIVLSV